MFRRDDKAVSSMIGTILMIAITVTVFTGVGIVVIGEVSEDPGGSNIELVARQLGNQSLVVEHLGGEELALTAAYMVVQSGGAETEYPLTVFADQTADGTNLAIGDALCVQGLDAACLYAPGVVIDAMFIVADNSLILTHGTPGSSSSSPVLPDLSIPTVNVSPDPPQDGQTATFTATIQNVGPGTMAAASAGVTLAVNAVEQDTATAAGPLSPGQSVEVMLSWSAAEGEHTITITVDPLNAITEENEGNNVHTETITIGSGAFDPGQAYEDVNNDLLFDAGTDVLIPNAVIRSGTYDASSSGLVIPPSVGDITADSISFTAQDGIYIGVDLTAGNGDLTLTSGDDLNAANVQLTNDDNDGSIRIETNTGGDIDLTASRITGKGPIDIDGRNIDLTDATLTQDRDHTTTVTSAADITLDGALIQVDGDQVWSATGTINADAATSLVGDRSNRDLEWSAEGSILAPGVQMDIKGDILWSTNGDINADDSRITTTTSNRFAYFVSNNDDVSFEDAFVDATGYLYLLANEGSFNADGANLESDVSYVYLVGEGDSTAVGTTIRADSSFVYVYSLGGTMDATDVTIDAKTDALVYAAGAMTAVRADLETTSGGGEASIWNDQGSLDATDASLSARKYATIQALDGSLVADGAILSTNQNGGYCYVHSKEGTIQAERMDITAKDHVYIVAKGDLHVDDGVFEQTRGGRYIEITSDEGEVFADGIDLSAKGDAFVTAEEEPIHVASADFHVDGDIEFELGSNSNTLYLDQVTFEDLDGDAIGADVSPGGVNINGSPAKGWVN